MSVIQFTIPARNHVSQETELYNQDVGAVNVRAYVESDGRYRFLVLALEPLEGILGYNVQVSYVNKCGKQKVVSAPMRAIVNQPGNFEAYLKIKCVRENAVLSVSIIPIVQ